MADTVPAASIDGVSPASIDAALRRIRRDSGVGLAFGGTVATGTRGLHLKHFVGSTVGALNGVIVDAGQGLGGKVMTVQRPIIVDDYLRTPTITHRYNRVIAAERLRSVAAVPVIVDRRPVAVLYGGLHGAGPIGDRALDVLATEARALEQRVVADRIRAERQLPDDGDAAALQERITLTYARLRSLVTNIDDQFLADEIADITAGLTSGALDGAEPIRLTDRELDVVSLLALGYSNARIGDRLGLRAETVKGYVKVVLRKLGASSRYEAVVLARRRGLLP